MAKIELQGMEQMIADIRKKLGNAATRMENRALRKAGEPIAEGMKNNVSRTDIQHPHIEDDIRVSGVRRDSIEGTRFVLIGGTKKTNWRWYFQEYGTSQQSAAPFVEPGFEEGKNEAQSILAEEFRKGLME